MKSTLAVALLRCLIFEFLTPSYCPLNIKHRPHSCGHIGIGRGGVLGCLQLSSAGTGRNHFSSTYGYIAVREWWESVSDATDVLWFVYLNLGLQWGNLLNV